jgi:hypothetical protein
MIKVATLDKFDGCGRKVLLDTLKKEIVSDPDVALELIPRERIIKLHMPFAEIYSQCNESEWEDMSYYIQIRWLRHKAEIRNTELFYGFMRVAV